MYFLTLAHDRCVLQKEISRRANTPGTLLWKLFGYMAARAESMCLCPRIGRTAGRLQDAEHTHLASVYRTGPITSHTVVPEAF